MKNDRIFILPENRGELVISYEVLKHFDSYVQNSFIRPESGGQLFSANPDEMVVRINKATGPYFLDKRSRCSFNLNVNKANKDRQLLFKKGLYAVGLWHTHAQAIPTPSELDKTTTFEYLAAFKGSMDCFLQIIVGNSGIPINLGVWVALIGNSKDLIKRACK